MAEVHGGDVYRNQIEYDFSVSLNPLGCPSEVKSAIVGAADKISRYPDPYQEQAVTALSEAYGLAPENFVCGNGASEWRRGQFFCRRLPFRGMSTPLKDLKNAVSEGTF